MTAQLIRVRLDQLHSRGNVRAQLGDLATLASSYRDGQPEQPPVVHRNGSEDNYIVIFGHRRVEAARVAGSVEMDVILRDPLDDGQRIVLQLIENLHRADLSPLDEARAFNELIRQGQSQRDISRTVGRSEAYISQRLSLLTLSPVVLLALTEGEISTSVAEQLIRLDYDQQRRVVPRLKGRPVSQARTIIDQCLLGDAIARERHVVDAEETNESDEYSVLLRQGEDPLFVPALAELQAALTTVCDVYGGYRLSQSTGQLRRRIRETAQQLADVASEISKCTQNQNGGNHNGK